VNVAEGNTVKRVPVAGPEILTSLVFELLPEPHLQKNYTDA